MKLEIYFDYLCEFCKEGHHYWTELLPQYPHIEPIWMPCEAHPRTEEPNYGNHSDLAIQGMLFVQEHGGNVNLYNDCLFDAIYLRGENIESIAVLMTYAKQAGVDPASFEAALTAHTYETAQQAANTHAYEKMHINAVPTYIFENGRRIDAALGIGVTKSQLELFLQSEKYAR